MLLAQRQQSLSAGNYEGLEIIGVGIVLFFMSGGMVISLITYGVVIVISDWRAPGPRPKGLCKNCEYDLRGNASGICPECGTRIEIEAANH